MELDTNKIDDAVLALLYLGLHDEARAWKGFDWQAMDRLSERGYISDPDASSQQLPLWIVLENEPLNHWRIVRYEKV